MEGLRTTPAAVVRPTFRRQLVSAAEVAASRSPTAVGALVFGPATEVAEVGATLAAGESTIGLALVKAELAAMLHTVDQEVTRPVQG